jgi:hypothetical protein
MAEQKIQHAAPESTTPQHSTVSQPTFCRETRAPSHTHIHRDGNLETAIGSAGYQGAAYLVAAVALLLLAGAHGVAAAAALLSTGICVAEGTELCCGFRCFRQRRRGARCGVMMRSANGPCSRRWAIRFEIQILQDGTYKQHPNSLSCAYFRIFMHAPKEDLCIDTWYFLFLGVW